MFARSLRLSVTVAAATAALTAGAGLATADTAAPAAAAGELQSVLTRFTDPAVPAADKTQLMVNGGAHTANLDKMNQGLANYGTIGWTVSDVQANGDTANASVAISSPHGTMPGVPMTWQHTDAGWQLSENTACTILAMGKAPC
ncbi:hypothetical protein D7D52_30955 [Nocardia yunnanensis]|uniref:Low molecular weight antigen MTB12-like C-terminal domain-containing protein n=1 Tax=Nocardia yunnanensis TaxID=2382165 RepID=A0A386ZLI9_9NOCA|nr:hypothetical protein [Nocardia yunnanensis]AYF77499.1 hypothetical protein D7D52_30955 [Nocardia yunnanensis]